MRVAIVGAGFAGAAAAYFLSQHADVTLFDAGGGASHVSSGLMHPFPGKQCRLSDRAYEGISATRELLEVAATALGREVSLNTGIVRLSLDVDLKDHVSDDVEWWSKERIGERFPGTNHPGIYIKSGVTVYPEQYLKGLILAANIEVRRERIGSLDDLSCECEKYGLDAYDRVILALGSGIETVVPGLPLKYLKGQILTVKAPYPISMSLIGNGYIAATEDPAVWHIGSTYERSFASSAPDQKQAEALILPKLKHFLDVEEPLVVTECRSGVRVASKNGYHPVVKQHSEKVWIITGMGSRGLLYHALIAKELVSKFIN